MPCTAHTFLSLLVKTSTQQAGIQQMQWAPSCLNLWDCSGFPKCLPKAWDSPFRVRPCMTKGSMCPYPCKLFSVSQGPLGPLDAVRSHRASADEIRGLSHPKASQRTGPWNQIPSPARGIQQPAPQIRHLSHLILPGPGNSAPQGTQTPHHLGAFLCFVTLSTVLISERRQKAS